MITAKFSDILEGYEFSSQGGPTEVQAFLSLERGTVHIVSDDLELEEPPPDDIESGPYLALPGRAELGLGRDLAIDYAKAHMPDEVPAVIDLFRRRGAYKHFKNLLERKDLLQAWYDHEARVTQSCLRAWCADHGIELT
jgi:hypothetical protein